MNVKKMIVVRRTVTIEDRIPFTSNHYPDCDTPEEAAIYERELPMYEKLTLLSESLDAAPEDRIDYGEVITVEDYDPK